MPRSRRRIRPPSCPARSEQRATKWRILRLTECGGASVCRQRGPCGETPMRPGNHFALAVLLAAFLLASGASAQQPAPSSTPLRPPHRRPPLRIRRRPHRQQPHPPQRNPLRRQELPRHPPSRPQRPPNRPPTARTAPPSVFPTTPARRPAAKPDTASDTSYKPPAAKSADTAKTEFFPRPARTSTRTSRRAARTTWTPSARATSAVAAWATGTPPTGRSRLASSTHGDREVRPPHHRPGGGGVRQPRGSEHREELRLQGAVHHQGDRLGRDQRHGPAGRVLLRQLRADPGRRRGGRAGRRHGPRDRPRLRPPRRARDDPR